MKPKVNNIFIDNVQMDTYTVFKANGDIKIEPCPWEDNKTVTRDDKVHYRAGVRVEANGRTVVKRYNEGTGPKLELLCDTAHGEAKMTRPAKKRRYRTREYIYVTFKFPKQYGPRVINECLRREMRNIMDFFRSRKEETIWK